MKPAALGAESSGIAPAAFRALLVNLLGPATQQTTAAGTTRYMMAARRRRVAPRATRR
jgi:hypothetical protein